MADDMTVLTQPAQPSEISTESVLNTRRRRSSIGTVHDDIVNRLNSEVRRVLQLPDVRARLRPEGIEPGNLDAKAFTEFVAAEVKRWAPVVKASGAKAD